METPIRVEAYKRTNAQRQAAYIVINHERTEQSISLSRPAREYLGKHGLKDELKLEPYGVAVFTHLLLEIMVFMFSW